MNATGDCPLTRHSQRRKRKNRQPATKTNFIWGWNLGVGKAVHNVEIDGNEIDGNKLSG